MMARKADIRICRYCNCDHLNKEIDISKDEFKVVKSKGGSSAYYHKKCFESKKNEEHKDAQTKADIQLIKNLWLENISQTVVIPVLYQELNKLIFERKISSEYIIFVLQYCIKHNCKLRYPAGIKYYVDNQEIKDAYSKSKVKKVAAHADFSAKENEDNTPKFSVNRKPSGFNSILSRKH